MVDLLEWVTKHIQDARELFGLGGAEWHVTARLTDKPGGDHACDGFVSVDAVYQNATIEIADTLTDDENGRAAIYHEVLHIAHESVDHLVDQALQRLPRHTRKVYQALYREAVESFIQRLSRSIVARLKPDAEAKE